MRTLPQSEGSDPEHGIYRVQYVLRFNGAWINAISDLIFIDNLPHIVLEWHGPSGMQSPLVMQKLDPELLQEFRSQKTDLLYKGQIEDLRKVN